MASNPDLRPHEEPSARAEGFGVARSGPPVRLTALLLVAAAALSLTLAQLAGRSERAVPAPPGFLAAALGAPQAGAPLAREPVRGVRVAVERRAFRFERDGRTAGLAQDGAAGGDWTRFAGGVSRPTPFGRETIVLRGEDGLEQFLTVERRQGRRTWRWRLTGSTLEPLLRPDGSIELLDGDRSSGLRVAPVAILDAAGEAITPNGLRWHVARRGAARWLELDLDDARLPLPYTIDPAITSTAATTATGASGLNPGRPGSVGDLLVAQVFTRGSGAIATPSGWTQIRQSNTANASQAVFWTWGGTGTVTSFSWAGGGNGGAQIVAVANAHPTSPVDASSTSAGTSATATATGVTTAFPSELVVALLGQATNNAFNAPAGTSSLSTVTQSGNPNGRVSLLAAGAIQASAGATGNLGTAANGDWVAQLVTIRQAPDDGDGTIAASPASLGSSSTGNTITLTYTAGVQGTAAGAVAVDVPTGWSAPSTTGSAAGYTTASTGTVGVSGQRITVSNVTLAAGGTLTITYGSKASGGPGATSSSATGAVTWAALQRGTSVGTLTAIAGPSVNQYAANGSGTAGASPTVVSAGATGTTVTVTYTAATGGMSGGAVSVDVPSGWSAPSTANGSAGYTTASTGTVGVAGQTITVTGVTLSAGATLTLTYGTGAGPGATSPSTPGTQTWQVQQRSTSSGTLTSIGDSPQVRVNAKPTATVSLAPASPTTDQTLTATATRTDPDAGDTVTLTYVWKVDGTTVQTTSGSSSLTDSLDLSVAGNGDRGQTVAVEVTPNDGVENGTMAGGSVTVANSAPVMTSAAIGQAAPKTNDTLTVTVASTDADGDARSYAYQWRRNGVDISGATGATLDLSVAGNGDKGDQISVRVTAGDGSATSAALTSAAVTVVNSAPVVDAVSIDQAAPGTNDTLTLTVTSHDDDPGDTVASTFQWTKNGSDLAGATGATLELATAGNGDEGDVLRARVTGTDGTGSSAPVTSAPVTVANTLPTATVSLSPGSPTTDATATATAAPADADGDAVTLTYVWKVNGSTVRTTSASASLTDALDLSLPGNGDKGQTVSVEVTPDDGSGSGSTVGSSVTVANSAPTVSAATILPASPTTDGTLSVAVVSADPDGDPRSYSYQWRRNGSVLAGETGPTLDLSQPGNGDKGDGISVEVVADDGTASSAPSSSGAVTVQNSAPVVVSATIDQAGPTTDDALTVTVVASDPDAADTLTLAYQWALNGVDRFGETAAGYDLAPLGSGDKGDQITVRVTASDGSAGSAPVTSGARTIANAVPLLGAVTIDQAAPRTDDTLSATVTAGDPDGDTLIPTYQWLRNGSAIAGQTGPTLDLSQPGNGDRGDQLALRVGVSDGTDGVGPLTSTAVTVQNTAPAIASVAIDQAAPLTGETLTVTVVSSDADGDARTYAYEWRLNGAPLTGETGATLDLSLPGNGSRDDDVQVRVTASDGADVSAPATSPAVTVANTAPTCSPTTLATTQDTPADVAPVCTDPDGDALAPSIAAQGAKGVASVVAGLLRYAPNAGEGGADAFAYRASDGTDESASATVAVTIDDVTAPETTIDAGPPAGSTQTSTGATFAFSSDDPLSTFECRLDGGAWSACTSPHALGGLGEGAHTFAVRATDGTGNTDASPASRSWTVDSVAPETALDSAPADPSGDATPTFAFSSEPGATFEVRVDGGAWTPAASPYTTAALGEGPHTFAVRATDAAGNTDPTPAAHAWTLDAGAPTVALAAPGSFVNAADADPYALVATTPDADVTQVEFRACSNAGCAGGTETSLGVDADGAPWTLSVPLPPDGRWTIKAVATDGAANTGEAVVDATVDRAAPTGGSIAYADGWSAGGTVAVALDGGTDAGSGLDAASAVVERDAAPLSLGSCGAFSGTWTPATVPDAPASGACYAYRYRISDLAGNEAVYGSGAVVKRDATAPPAPDLAFSAFTNAAASGGVVWFRPGAAGGFTVTPSAADVESGIASFGHPDPGAGWSRVGPAWSFTAAALDPVEPNGVTATNGAGTTGPAASFVVDADATAPTTIASASPAPNATGWHTSTPVAVTLTATDAESGVAEIRYTTDGSEPSPTNGTVYSTPVAVGGTTTVKFRAVDAVGNEEAVGSLLVRIDVTAPTTPNLAFSSLTNAFASGGVVYYRPSAAGGFTVAHDAADPESGLGSTAYPPLGPGWSESGGAYTFAAGAADPAEPSEVTVANGAGLVSAGAPITVTADPAPPVTTATTTTADGANGWHVSTPVTVTLSATDALSGVAETRWSSDGSAPATPYTAPLTLSAEGETTVRFASEDQVGNVEATGSELVRIDTVAPAASMDALPAFATGTVALASSSSDATSGVDAVAYEFRAAGAPSWTPTPAAWATTGLPNGVYEVRVLVTDLAGNTTASVAATTVVDTTAPSVTLDPPPSPASGTVLLSATATDAHSGVTAVEFAVSPAGAGTWSATGASWDTTGLPDGVYDVRARASDAAGNVSAWSQANGIQVDNEAPDVTLTSPLDGGFVNAASPDPRTVTATADDGAGAGVASVAFYAWTGAAWSPLGTDATAPYEAAWTLPADGPGRVKAVATDGAGHTAESEATVTVDRTPPVPGIGDPGADVRGTVALTGSAADATSGIGSVDFQRSPAGADTWTTIATDADGSDGWSASLDTTLGLAPGASDGLYDVRVFVTDAAGNAAIALVTGMRIDNTSPTAGLTDPGADLRGTVALAGAAADAGSGVAAVAFQLAPEGTGTWATIATDTDGGDGWSASLDTTLGLPAGASDGVYDLRVLVTDRAGNAAEHVVASRRIDNTPPTATLTDPGAALRLTVALGGDATDAGGSGVATVAFERRPSGGGAWTTIATDPDGSDGWSASLDTTAVADGLHDLRVVATDAAGNTSSAVVAARRVDNTAPTAAIDDPGPYLRATVILTGSASDVGGSGVASVQFQRGPAGGGGPWSPIGAPDVDGGDGWSASLDTTSLADGLHDLRVLVADAAGNTATAVVAGRMVDNTAPATTDDAPTSSASPVTVTLSASDAGSGPSATQFRLDGGAWQSGTTVGIPAPADHSNDGLHTVEYYSTDAAGNVEPVRSTDVLIDTAGPSGSVGNPDDYLRGLVRLSAAPDDPGDVASVRFDYAPAGTSAWAPIGGLVLTAPYEVDWDTTGATDGAYDLQVTLTDALGNESVSSLPGRTVDNTAPTGTIAAPAAGAVRSGDVALAASAADAGSGVAEVEFFVRPAGASSFGSAGTDAAGPTYSVSWDSTTAADGSVDVQAVVRDVAGNETTTAPRTFTADNDAPDVTVSAPGGAVSGTVQLAATGSADVAQVQFAVDGAPVGTDTDGSDGWSVPWATSGDGTRQVTARATDVGGNTRTSAPVAVLVDNTAPSATMTAPAPGATVGGPAVPLAASASDAGGSGVAATTFQFKAAAASTWTDVAGATWDATPLPTGAYDLRAKVTDAAGNVGFSAAVTVQADSTAPTVALASPGAALSGVVTLTATTSGVGAQSVVFERSPAGADTWTPIATDPAAPWSAAFDTRAVGDGDYDLRATVHDAFGNTNEHRRNGIRIDNTSPFVVSSTPGDGATLTAAPAQVDVTASEPLDAVTGLTLDGAPVAAAGLPGSSFTVAPGTLAAGPHVLAGTLVDRGGRTRAFGVHFTVLGGGGGPLPYVEANGSATGSVSLTSPDGATRLVIPAGTFSPGGADWIVYRIRPVPAASVVTSSAGPPTSIVDVTARWALAGTEVHTFPVPLDLVLLNASANAVVPVTLEGSTWRVLRPVPAGTLPADRQDGFYRAADGIHVLTRHLSLFALVADVEPPTPPSAVGVVDADGLKLRWVPGTDSSGAVGQVKLYVNGSGFAHFDPTQTEEPMGPWTAADARAFQFSQFDLAGNESTLTRPLRGVPALAGASLAQAGAALAARGFSVGKVTEAQRDGVSPGTVVEPRALALAEEGAAIDLVVAAGGPAVPALQARLVLSAVGTKTYTPRAGRAGTVALRLKSSRRARVTATLLTPRGTKLYTWRFAVEAGATVRTLRVPRQVTRPGVYRIVVAATAGGQVARATVRLRIVGKRLRPLVVPPRRPAEIVLAGGRETRRGLARGLGAGARVVRAGADGAFALTGNARRDVRVIVVDVDVHGLGLVRDLHTVFPDLRLVALAGRKPVRAAALRAGAAVALPRSTPAARLAHVVARAARAR